MGKSEPCANTTLTISDLLGDHLPVKDSTISPENVCEPCRVRGRYSYAYFSIDFPMCISCFLIDPEPPPIPRPEVIRVAKEKVKRPPKAAKPKEPKFHANVVETPEEIGMRATAHNLVSYGIKSGKIIKQPCEICGRTDDVEAHHEDYSKPLELRWLCGEHHGLVTFGRLVLLPAMSQNYIVGVWRWSRPFDGESPAHPFVIPRDCK